jgi:exopolysaccharide biosynthesis protein
MKRKPIRFLSFLIIVGVVALVACSVCWLRDHPASASSPTDEVVIAKGVVYRAVATGDARGVDLVDVDLRTANARIAIATDRVVRGSNGEIAGMAYTPQEWMQQRHALAAVNGGYFGYTADDAGCVGIVGLLMRRGKVIQQAHSLYGRGSALIDPGRYVRSAFGLTSTGEPSIGWVATLPSGGSQAAYSYTSPVGLTGAHRWRVADAIGCGPTIIRDDKADVTDHQERLASPGDLPRTFVAYDTDGGRPRHFVMGVASSSDFDSLALFLLEYYLRYHHDTPHRAMCLDGGPSSQISYRGPNGVASPMQTGTSVPVAVLVVGK